MTLKFGDGPVPVVLIHASGSGAQQMAPLARMLVAEENSLQVSIPDLCGYAGVVAKTPRNPIQDHLSILAPIVANFNRPCFIIGHSMGGFLALKLATTLSTTQFKNRVLGIVAIEPTAFGMLTDHSDDIVRKQDQDVINQMRELVEMGKPGLGIACFIEFWNQTPWLKIPQTVRDRLQTLAPQILTEASAISADRTSDYSIDVPVHLMVGQNSPLPAQRIVTRLSQALSCVSVERIAGVGHMSLLRNPEKFVPGILKIVR